MTKEESERLMTQIAAMLDSYASFFPDGVMFTFIARCPGCDDHGMIVSGDNDFAKLAEALTRNIKKPIAGTETLQ